MLRFVRKKYIYQSLRKVFGINKHTVEKVIGILGIKKKSYQHIDDINIRKKLKEMFLPMIVDFKLRLIIFSRILLLIFTKTYRGMRHIQGLPSRGQRTHANGKTPKSLKKHGKNLPFPLRRRIKLEL